MHPRPAKALTLAAGALAAAAALAAPSGDARAAEAARFRVTDKVVNADLPPFSASVAHIGTSSSFVPAGGYEPAVFRDQFRAIAPSRDRVFASQAALTAYNGLRDGALDGAEVEVRRVIDGRLVTVRRDRVAEGGHRAESWESVMPRRAILPPDAREAAVGWPGGYRGDAPEWLTVRAVGFDGGLSARAEAVKVTTPSGRKRGPRKIDGTVRFRAKLTEERRGPAAPSGLAAAPREDGGVTLTWSAPRDPDVAGYVIEKATLPPDRIADRPQLVLEGGDGPEILAEDAIIIRKDLHGLRREDVSSNFSWNFGAAYALTPAGLGRDVDERTDVDWALVDHAPDTPVEDPGRTYLSLSLDPGARVGLGGVSFSGTGQDYFEVLHPEPYRFEAWVRADRPMTGEFGAVMHRKPPVADKRFQVDTQWRRVTGEFTPTLIDGNRLGRFVMRFSGPGRVDIDNFRVYRVADGFLDFTAEQKDVLARSGLGILRTHGSSKTGRYSYDLELLTNPAGAGPVSTRGATLHSYLEAIEGVGMDPWVQVEMHFTDEEWQGLVEYLAAPAGAGKWADKRASQGHPEPWVDTFDRILFEVSNETWNRIMAPWIFQPMVDGATGRKVPRYIAYGLLQQHVIDAMKASPWWTPAMEEKIEFVIGGWYRTGYGFEAGKFSPGSAHMTVAAYNGGWEENGAPPSRTPISYFNVLNQISQATIPFGRKHVEQAQELSRMHGRPVHAGTYEGGPGYSQNGLNGAKVTDKQVLEQNQVMKSQAGGVATLDVFLAQAALGYREQNIFIFQQGKNWSTHAEWIDGGHAYPHWTLLTHFSREGRGDMLEVETLAAPTADLEAVGRIRLAVEDAPLAAAYATRNGERFTLVVLSRRIPGTPGSDGDACTPVEVELPIRSAASLTVHKMDGPYDAHNFGPEEQVKLTEQALTPPADLSRFTLSPAVGAAACGVPPGSVYIYTFDGVE
ncbi:hypothetical protein ACQ5SO_08695 [Rhodovulum sp. DZ06]|uniref:hypothetical protein n=1 Tax=Rhodovulum sp. DZ06 TaxID=3425126 RepID=UPI003D358511